MEALQTTPKTCSLNTYNKVLCDDLDLDSFALTIANLLSAVRTFNLLDDTRLKEVGFDVLEFTHEYALAIASTKQQHSIRSGNKIACIRTKREACGLTTAELARLLDLDEEIIIQWESGEYEPTISMLIPLANVLGCDPLSLLSENNTAVPVRVNAPEAHMESIGTRIKSARKKLGLTESDLARMINTYSDPINDWECGIHEVPADQIVPLASALNCDLVWLLTGKSEAKE
ncbi:helix-turn-helix domain-containing protein [Escherichia coli]|uniref:helix-turn-helix domain-containing protein n=1 Tax=Escherichia coli TaxID=562 RepID=UPI0006827D0F|nr:helix-turn-helix domain-containing protein [Escherichia coli]EEC7263603.1 helix-turn-helix domain-containing protein [Escherichia coli]EER7675652.1 helix-turn-helix domain-containing protein [Escherichia coli]EES0628585.1 helix-turn-helix domain-containing protein [Escherichia coli]EES9743416.1 helix-turn-helix domain-containing protein [Escherichia coli]EET1054447.1 helix-turn-helix domain-containing protein [Escherichia coli]